MSAMASTSIIMSAIYDIRHRHLLFRYRKKTCRTENCHSDIGRVPISTSDSIPTSDIHKIIYHICWIRTPDPCFHRQAPYFSATVPIYEFLDVGYWISDKSLFRYRYNVGLCSLQSDIRSSDIKLSPISLITEIGVSAHLWNSK
jgi:hypothetical protein